jgi:hypothetical protein
LNVLLFVGFSNIFSLFCLFRKSLRLCLAAQLHKLDQCTYVCIMRSMHWSLVYSRTEAGIYKLIINVLFNTFNIIVLAYIYMSTHVYIHPLRSHCLRTYVGRYIVPTFSVKFRLTYFCTKAGAFFKLLTKTQVFHVHM